MGTGYQEDAPLLKAGGSCIIRVDESNSPHGFWWGTVIEVVQHATHLGVKAKITGGPLAFHNYEPVRSDLHRGREPSINYIVYPDTGSTRDLFERILKAEATNERLRDAITVRKQLLEEIVHTLLKDAQGGVREHIEAKLTPPAYP